MAITALAITPRNPNNLSRQVARLAASHQINKKRQPRSGPKTDTIQYFAAPSSKTPGPNRAASIRTGSKNAGHALSGRHCLRELSVVSVRSGAFSFVVRSFMCALVSIAVEQRSRARQENLPSRRDPETGFRTHALSHLVQNGEALFLPASRHPRFKCDSASYRTGLR